MSTLYDDTVHALRGLDSFTLKELTVSLQAQAANLKPPQEARSELVRDIAALVDASPQLRGGEAWLEQLSPAMFTALELVVTAREAMTTATSLPLSNRIHHWCTAYQEALSDYPTGHACLADVFRVSLGSVRMRIVLRAAFDVCMEAIFMTKEAQPYLNISSGLTWETRRQKANLVATFGWDGWVTLMVAWTRLPMRTVERPNELYGVAMADAIRSNMLAEVPGIAQSVQSAIRTALWIARPPFIPLRASSLAKFAHDTLAKELITDSEDEIWADVIGEKPEATETKARVWPRKPSAS